MQNPSEPGSGPSNHPIEPTGKIAGSISSPVMKQPIPGITASAQIPSLEPFVTQVTIARANDLARHGNYQEAEELLNSIPDGKNHPVILDLLARMRAQQGRWQEAEAFWKQAVVLDPTNPDYLEGLQYVQRKLKPTKISHLFSAQTFMWLLAIAGLVLLAWGGARLVILGRNLAKVSNQVQTLKNSLDLPQPTLLVPTQRIEVISSGEISELSQKLDKNQAENQAILENLQGQLELLSNTQQGLQSSLLSLQPTSIPKLEILINVPGTHVEQKNNQWIIYFNEGLFPYGWALDEQARSILAELSLQLKPYVDRIRISITGFQSNDEQSSSFDLSLGRAAIVLNYLKNTGQLPEEILQILPQGSQPLPFPNDTIENRARNRTVILTIEAEEP